MRLFCRSLRILSPTPEVVVLALAMVVVDNAAA